MALLRRLEEIHYVVQNLVTAALEGIPIIVEGYKDVISLRQLGVTGDIISAKTAGRTSLDVLSEIENLDKKEVILLLDFDKRGRDLTTRLERGLESLKCKPNTVFWRELRSLVGNDVKDIEGLMTYFRTLNKKIGKNILDLE